MSFPSKAGTLSAARSTTGRDVVKLPSISSVVTLFITTTGTFSLNVEVSNVTGVYVPITTITAAAAVQVAMPVNAIAVNVTAITGTVTVTYQMIVRDALPAEALQIFQAGAQLPPFTQPISGTLSLTDNRKRLYGPAQPGTVAATIYTTPVGKKTAIEFIQISNDTASTATITISITADGAATRILDAFPIPAHGVFSQAYELSLAAGEIIQAFQGTSSALTVTINGTEA